MGCFCNSVKVSSLIGDDSVNILAAASKDNNSEYIAITRLLATDLNTETITSDHYEVFLSLLQSLCNPLSQSVFS
jgi:hypothetical protein